MQCLLTQPSTKANDAMYAASRVDEPRKPEVSLAGGPPLTLTACLIQGDAPGMTVEYLVVVY